MYPLEVKADLTIAQAHFRKLTQLRHWPCPAAELLMPVLALSTYLFEPLRCHLLSLGLAMKRREFITLVGGAAAAWPLAANAQQKGKLPLIGVLNPGSTDVPGAVGFYDGLRELGYTEGLNIAIERRYGDSNTDRFQQLAADLVRLKVDVIVVISTSPARAAKQATSIIPIVVGGMADPVGDELIVSLARPGGNITGTTFLGPELIAKRFGLLKEAISGLSRVAALWHPAAYGKRTMEGMLRETETAAQALRLQLQLVPAVGPGRPRRRLCHDGPRARRCCHSVAQPDVIWRAQTDCGIGGEEPAPGNVRRKGVCGGWGLDVLRSKPA